MSCRSFFARAAFWLTTAALLTRPVMGATKDEWKDVDKLVDEQKLEEAAKKVEAILADAKKGGDEARWTKALIKTVQLRTALHGYETSVRFLKDQPWPKGLLPHATLQLYYAHALVYYLQMYSWEIRQREKVEAKGPVDLKAWTADQIYAEAQKAYDALWAQREELGKHPVKDLAEYVQPNTYPAGIRPTLRDALTYFTVALLADSSQWRPEESNELYRLDLKQLLSAKPDPARHPLAKLVERLDDLEAWHAAQKQPEAALEARLERLRRLHAAYSDQDKRATIRADLEGCLGVYKDLPWWAMGQAELARMARESGDLVRAHDLAAAGAKAFPGSPGSARCLSLQKELEQPDYSLASMLVDGAKERSLQVRHKNLKKLYFRAYPGDLVKHVEAAQDYSLMPDYEDLRRIAKGKPEASWETDLEDPKDYALHSTFVTPPMTRKGLHVVVASANKDFSKGNNRIQGYAYVVSDLVILSRTDTRGGLDVSVVDGKDGKPVQGAELRLYKLDYGKKHAVTKALSTDAKGSARFTSGGEYASYFLMAQKDDDVTIDPQSQYLQNREKPETSQSSLVYTDRSIYRPGQTLHYKVIAYRTSPTKNDYRTLPDIQVAMTLVDANGQNVAVSNVKTNAYGSASGEIKIPEGRLLGQWYLRSSYGGAGASVRVEEYKRPTFEVTLKDPDAPLRLNKDATLKGEAKYYFGLPVTSGGIRWKVTREPVYPWWWGYWFWRGGGGGGGRAQTVAAGTAKLDEKGGFEVKFKPEAEEKSGDAAMSLSYRYAVSVDLTDEGGETRSTSRSFRVGYVAVEARIAQEKDFLRAGEKSALTIARTSLDGVPRAGKGSWKLVALKQPAKAVAPADLPIASSPDEKSKEIPGDKLRARWEHQYSPEAELARWPDGDEQAKGDVTHDAKGQAEVALPSLKAGAYRLRYETTDEFGAKAESWHDFLVAGNGENLALPLVFQLEESTVKVGGTARFHVHTGLPNQTLFLDLYRDGELKERRVLTSASPALVEIPIAEADRGGFGATLTLVADHQLVHVTHSVWVPWDDKELTIDFATFRDKLRPGAKETFKVTIKGPKAAESAAEVLAYMYDKSLDVFAPHAVPSTLSLFPSRGGTGWLRANLQQAWAQDIGDSSFASPPGYAGFQDDVLLFESGYGIGGPGAASYGMRGGGHMMNMAPAPSAAPAMKKAARAKSVEKEESAAADMAAPAEPMAEAEGRADDKASADAQAEEKPKEVRSNFAETAFFQPHLLTGKDGSVTVEFQVPDSVTAWNFWVVAVTKDLRSGTAKKETQSVKDLMVRPYMPRFFREGDAAELKVVVNNASDKELKGELTLEIVDPETAKSVAAEFGVKEGVKTFTVAPSSGATLVFPVSVPRRVGQVAFRVTAKAGNNSDGELRPLPVLPSRMHLVQSRFVTLRDKETRTMSFADLAKGDDPSLINDRMVVTLDGQLFYSVLKALPYLQTYPYECTEQTLNRFLSTGIVSSVYKEFPQVAKMAQKMAKRDSQLEKWDASDPNNKMTLEESPWLVEAKGGKSTDDAALINTLDPAVAKAQREAALAKLRKAQTSSGGFPWFPGSPPSPYITLYLMHGFARAAEFGLDVPKDMVVRGWNYLARHFREEYARKMIKEDCCWEYLTFLNYVATSYPDDSWTGNALTKEEKKEILDFTFSKWKKHSPYLKGYLALTLKRYKREKDAQLVFDSVMDSAKTEQDLGTFWAPEDRAWLWYNDTIETHAFALRTLTELRPDDKRRDGLVLWLFLNKKLSHWKSTRATAEVIYSLVHYLRKEGQLGLKEAAKVTVGPETKTFTFDPEEYQGKQQLVIPGEKIDPKTSSTIKVEKETKGLMFASATWHFSTEKLPAEERGVFFNVSRKWLKRDGSGKDVTLRPLAEGEKIQVGDELEIQISLKSKAAAEYVHLRDPRAAGLEPENAVSRYKYDLGIGWYEEVRDSGTNFFFEWLPAGEYTFKYRLRASMAGTFKVGPATVQSMYAPEFAAYSAGGELRILP